MSRFPIAMVSQYCPRHSIQSFKEVKLFATMVKSMIINSITRRDCILASCTEHDFDHHFEFVVYYDTTREILVFCAWSSELVPFGEPRCFPAAA